MQKSMQSVRANIVRELREMPLCLMLCLAAATAYHLPSSTPRVGVVTMQQQVAPGQEVLLAGHDLTQTFDGQRFPFKNIDVLLPRGAKQGLVGVNGAGKSSLLRVLAEEDAPESGNLEKSRGVRVAYVEQDPSLPAGSTAADFVYLADAPAMVALREFNAAVEASSSATDDDEALAARLAKASSTMDAAGAWDLETEMKRLCTVLSVGHLLERPADSLSGGERKRIAIAAALLQEPDVLLLDEPTNHLDIDAIRWLEAEIRSRRSLCVLVVTHDRAFLSEACDEILELHATALYRHKGDYGSFLRAKEERLHAEANAEAADRNKLRAELRWVQRQPKARSTKSKARLDAYDQLASRVASTARPLGQVRIEAGMQRLGTAVLTCDALTVEVGGRTLFRDFSCEFARGARVGIVGPNGAGKSTFLKALMQQLPLAGGSVSCGETVVFGHYQQEGLKLPPGARVLALVQEAVSRSPSGGQDAARDESAASALLRRFLFPSDRWYTAVERLSGGERRRLQLLSVLALQPNVLLLDEPTNDLDLQTLAVLEDFATSFEGVVICVSHDRYFLDKVCDRLVVLPRADDPKAEVLSWSGSFSEYLTWRDETEAMRIAAANAPPPPPPPPPPSAAAADATAAADVAEEKPAGGSSKSGKALSAFETRELARLEAEVEELSEEQDAIQRRINKFDPKKNGYSDLEEWNAELEALAPKMEKAEERWLELAERA